MGEGRGENYDASHAEKMDALVWDAFIKKFVSTRIEACAAKGGKRYLDFACGTGRVLKVGSQHFQDYTGIDISEDMLSVARKRIPSATFLCGDVTTETVASAEQYDCVTLFRFLLNAERSLSIAVLMWIADHMPAGGILIGNNHMNTWSVRGIATILSNAILRTRYNHLSRSGVTKMLEASGFRILEWSGYRVLPTVKGKPVFGRRGQLVLERAARMVRFGRAGSEQLFVAERV